MKSTKGITLIALVVTIVVLLILAGISIGMLTGENGIVKKAQESKIRNNHATVGENLKLKVTDKITTEMLNVTNDQILQYLKGNNYIDENGIVNVENATGEKLTTGNGTDGKDIYFIKDGDLYYADSNGVEEKLEDLFDFGNIDIAEAEPTPEDYFDFDEATGTISLKNSPYYQLDPSAPNFPITDIVVPKTYNGKEVKKIGNFRYNNIKSVTILSGPSSIGYAAFYDCTSLTSVTIPDSITSIGIDVFRKCESLTSITIPNSVTSIGGSTFYGCSSLTSITIPNGVTSIDGSNFYGCSSLTSITIPNGVTYIGYDTFHSCTSLTNITIPDSVTNIEEYAFCGCSSLTNITIPNSVTNIGDYAFSGCTGLANVTIPNSVERIKYGAFSECSSLTSITIQNGVKFIGYDAFHSCTSLTNITIPDSVTSVASRAFDACSSLTDVYYTGTEEQWHQITIDSSGNDYLTTATKHYESTGE